MVIRVPGVPHSSHTSAMPTIMSAVRAVNSSKQELLVFI